MRRMVRYGSMFIAVAAVLGAGIAVAQDKMAAVQQRQALMKSNGQVVYRLVPGYIRNGKGTPQEIAEGAAKIEDNFRKIPALFVSGTSTQDLAAGTTKAKPEIWQNMAKFEAQAHKTADLAAALETAAKTGEKDKISAAYTSLNRDGCTACHNEFRAAGN